jgi:hypothetical protein
MLTSFSLLKASPWYQKRSVFWPGLFWGAEKTLRHDST